MTDPTTVFWVATPCSFVHFLTILIFHLKMMAACSSKTLESTYEIVWCHNPDDNCLNVSICGNLPQCKTDNLYNVVKAGAIYSAPHRAAYLPVHQHTHYPTSTHSSYFNAHWLACHLATRV
jgi:hypothetical protein